jgi:Ca2+/Na+ antiporter
MNFKAYLLTILFGTILCFVGWGMVVVNIDPEEAGILGFFLFYTTLFLGIVGLTSTIGLGIRKLIFADDDIVFRHSKRTFRQSLIFAILAITTLILLQLGILRWWNGIILLALGIVLEGMVYTNRKYRNQDYVR